MVPNSGNRLGPIRGNRAPQLRLAPISPVTPARVAYTLALGGHATDLQRADLTQALTDAVVEWDLRVYEVAQQGSDYEITSQPLPTTEPQAVSLVSIVAVIHPDSEAAVARLHALRTDDPVRVRGHVQGVFLRSVIRLDQALLID